MKHLWLVTIAVALLVLAGCAKPQHLPGQAHWYGAVIWVPTGDAAAVALAVCQTVEVSSANNVQLTERREETPWTATKLPSGGEVLRCTAGVQPQFTP